MSFRQVWFRGHPGCNFLAHRGVRHARALRMQTIHLTSSRQKLHTTNTHLKQPHTLASTRHTAHTPAPGDYTPDLRALLAADIIIATPEKWDGISRNWQTRG